MKWNRWSAGLSLLALVAFCGCTHSLEWKNRQVYRTMAFDTSREGLLVLLESDSTSEQAELLCLQVAQALSTRGGYRVRYMAAGNTKADVRLRVNIEESYKGRVSNFFISFPGYLIFTPAWLGYGYYVNYDVTCELENARTHERIGVVKVPITMSFRYTDGGRGWANVVIWPLAPFSFFNGLYGITYDNDITDMLDQTAYRTLGEYIAEKLIARINVEPVAQQMQEAYNKSVTTRAAVPAAPAATPATKRATTTRAKKAAPAVAVKEEAKAVAPEDNAPQAEAEEDSAVAAPAPAAKKTTARKQLTRKQTADLKRLREELDFGIIDRETYDAEVKAIMR